MTLAALIDFIKSVGVPAALAFYVLWRLDEGQRRLADLAVENNVILEQILDLTQRLLQR